MLMFELIVAARGSSQAHGLLTLRLARFLGRKGSVSLTSSSQRVGRDRIQKEIT